MRTLILSHLRLPIWLACKSQLWKYSNFHFKLKVAKKKVMFSWRWRSQLIFLSIANLHSNVHNFYFLIWLRWLSIDVFLNHNILINANFHFSFLFRLSFYQLIFFFISKYTFYFLIWLRYLSIDVFLNDNIQINTNIHFSLLFRLRFLSIDFFSIC